MALTNLSHYGDILAIPFFALLIYYFHTIHEKTELENVLYAFSIVGFVADVIYTLLFFKII